MKQTFKDNIVVTLTTVFVILCVVAAFVYNAFYGNPFSKKEAEKNIQNYIADVYKNTLYSMSDLTYNPETGDYTAKIYFTDKVDEYFQISYHTGDHKITDNYSETVASGKNTLSRLNSEYFMLVADIIKKNFSAEGYGQLGKHQVYENIEINSSLDMENLPADATVSIFLERGDTSADTFAQDLMNLQNCMEQNNVAVDYYDIMYNSTVLLEDFPSETVKECEDTAQLAVKVEEFLNKK